MTNNRFSTRQWLAATAIICAVFIALIWFASRIPVAVCAMEGGCPDAANIQALSASLVISVLFVIALAFAGNGRRRPAVGFARAALIVGALLTLYFVATSEIASGLVRFLTS